MRRWIRVSIPSFSVEVIGDGRTVFAMSGVAVLIPEVVSPSADDVARHGPLPARLDSTGPAGVVAIGEEGPMEPAFGHGMGLLMTIVVGGIIGWLASMVMKTNAQMGMIANVVVGIVGATLGGWLAGLIGIAPVSPLAGLLVAVVGASVLIAILKALNILR